jgi:hypothetical protein
MASWGRGRFFSIVILLTVLLGACSGSQDDKQEILSREQMVKMLIQIHLLEAKVQQLPLPHDSVRQVYAHFENKLFEQEGISREQYELTYMYYADRPKNFEKIYQNVLDSLTVLENRKRTAVPASVPIPDSIQQKVQHNPSFPEVKSDQLPVDKNDPDFLQKKRDSVRQAIKPKPLRELPTNKEKK